MKPLNAVTLYSCLFSLASTALGSSSCISFDAGWNLLAFNLGGKDYNAGTKDSWSSGSPTDITTNGRPPFTGKTTSCFFSQAGNTVYVLGADADNPSSIYIYDATAKSWSTQTTNPGSTGYDPTSAVAILDHDTDVFYSFSKGNLFLLRMENIQAAKSNAINWEDAGKPDFSTDGYQPVMGLASNHIHFLNVPGGQKGFANVYVIHFGFYQPEPQRYGDFPSAHGQAASVFLEKDTQKEFIYVPDDGSATYVINVISNTTQTLAGPPIKDAEASYFATPDTFVQFAPSKGLAFIPYNPSEASANTNAQWSTLTKLTSVASSGDGSGSGGSGSPSGSSTNTRSGAPGSPTGAAAGNNSNNNAGSSFVAAAARGQQLIIVIGMSLAVGLGTVGVALL